MNHTPGALRAAKLIVESMAMCWDMSAASRRLWEDAIASATDRETGARELLEALKDMSKYPNSNRMVPWLTLEKALAVIAKAEGRA